MKSFLISSLSIIYVNLIFVACGVATENKTEGEVFKIIHPRITDTFNTQEYVSELYAIQNIEVRSRVKDFIENIWVDEGQKVYKGQKLFTLNNKKVYQALNRAKAAVKVATADLKSAEIELENTKKLLKEDIVSQSEFEILKAKVEGLKAKLEEAQAEAENQVLNLSFTEISAPFDGIINRIPNKEGTLVQEGTLLTTISNDKEIFAYFYVSEKTYLDFVASKQQEKVKKVSLILANGKSYPYEGIIETTESEFNKGTGNIAFRARFPNPEKLLKHGSSGKVILKVKVPNALLVPQKSTFEIQDNIYVFVVDSSNIARIRKIKYSVRIPHFYVISEGLSKTDRFIYEGVQKAKDGISIKTELVDFPTGIDF